MSMSWRVNPGKHWMGDEHPLDRERRGKIAAIGSMFGAVLASFCCLGPLILVTLGASGAWIGNLAALSAYQPAFTTATFVLLGIGFWGVYGSQRRTCDQTAPAGHLFPDRSYRQFSGRRRCCFFWR